MTKPRIMKTEHLTYTGIRKRLKGKEALVQLYTDGRCLAQFDDMREPESHGWHAFRKQDFGL